MLQQQQPESDEDLMRGFRNGDPDAFGRLVRRHRDWVVRLLYAVVHDQDHAQDLAQEVFCRLYRNPDAYVSQGKFVPWLKQVAVNAARNFLRDHRTQRRRTLPWHDMGADLESGKALDPQTVFSSRLLGQEVRTALSMLSADQQQVVNLYYFGGQSVEEIAAVLGCPTGTVKSRLYHARRHLRAALQEERKIPL